jgi:hypothetical protein
VIHRYLVQEKTRRITPIFVQLLMFSQFIDYRPLS